MRGKPNNTTKFGPGNPGKPKGALNHTTKALKDMILGALDDNGGQKYLSERAKDQPGPFMALLGKVLPTQITGENGGPVKFEGLTDDELKRKIDALMDRINAR